MNNTLVRLTFIGLTVLIQGCSGIKIEKFEHTPPQLTLEEFFGGEVKGRGAFFSRSGVLSTRINVSTYGSWDGKTLTLKEHLQYDSGEGHDRTFLITKTNAHLYEARCSEFTSPGTIESYGNTLHWKYSLKENSKQAGGVTLDFDDWMFLNTDGTIINRAQASKWGFFVGEVFLSLERD